MPDVQMKACVVAAQKGDRDAFGDLVARTARLVTGVAYSVCGDFTRSEDIGQEVFLEAWRGLPRLEDPGKFTSWICTIARRRAIDELRRKSKQPTTGLPADPHEPSQSNPEAIMESKQKRELVWSMLEQLPVTYRETMILYYRSEQSVSEVAMALGENEPTIRQRLKRGRELLRSEMSELVTDTIRSTIPKAAFAAAVMAGIPKAAFAAGAAGTAGAATKAAATKAAATKAAATKAAAGAGATALGAAIGGSLIGLGGGILGMWNSWRNARFKSEQNFMLRQSILYGVGLVLFLVVLISLVGVKRYGWLSAPNYLVAYWILMAVAFVANMTWIFFVIVKGRRIETHAIASGEAMRPEVKTVYEQFIDGARVIREDGSVGYDVFRWDAGGWFGSAAGGLAWMLPAAYFMYSAGCHSAGTLTIACCVIGIVSAFTLWVRRSRLAPLHGIFILIAVIGVLAMVVLAAIQWLTNEKLQTAFHWHPACWLILLIFPAIGFHLQRIQRLSEKKLIEEDRLRQNGAEQPEP